jgi:hypothetical protein
MGRINHVLIHPMPLLIRHRQLLLHVEIQILNIKMFLSSEMIPFPNPRITQEILPGVLSEGVLAAVGVVALHVVLGKS